MDEETVLAVERVQTRTEIATLFRSVADQLDAGGPVTLDGDGRSVTVRPPEHPMFELEIERELGDDGTELSLELEIEWTEHEDGVDVTQHTSADMDDGSPSDSGEADTTKSLGRFEVFRDRAGEWRWRLVHRNGNIIATSGEGYVSRQNALKGLRSVKRNAPDAAVVSKWETTD